MLVVRVCYCVLLFGIVCLWLPLCVIVSLVYVCGVVCVCVLCVCCCVDVVVVVVVVQSWLCMCVFCVFVVISVVVMC